MNRLRDILLEYPQTALIFIISLVYLYFMQDMFLPTTGDQKTYMAQALEMHRDGNWFVQTLFDESNYYKGPLHFIFLRVGFFLFGENSMFATVYMNFFGLILLAILLYKFLLSSLDDKPWALFYASSVVLSIGVYSHSFASQMETELVICYGIAIYLVNKLETQNTLTYEMLLWIVVGLSGWLKSPAYGVFLGSGILLYWLMTSQFKERFFSKQSWFALIFGMLVGIAGYAPILYYDGDAFMETYILRESMSKGANGVPWTTAFFPIFTYFLAPWMFVAIFSYLVSIYRVAFKKPTLLGDEERRLVKLSIAISLPTLAFFTIHPYRGDIYALPIVSATMLMAYLFFRAYIREYERTYIWMMRLSAIVLSIVPLLIIGLYLRMSPMPEWFSSALFPLALFTFVFTLWFVFRESKNVLEKSPLLLSVAFIPLLLTLGLMLQSFGKAEMVGLHSYIEKNKITKPLGDYNLYQNYWNEYGALNFWSGHEIVGLHTKEKLVSFLEDGGSVIVEDKGRFEQFKANISDTYKMDSFDVYVWKRWLTHGKGPNGESMFLKYWNSKDISDIQRDFYIMRLKKPLK